MATQPKVGYPGYRKSFTCAEAIASALTNCGVVVERRAGTDLIGVAAAASNVVAGVAIDDIPAVRTTVTGPQVGDGHECTVYRQGEVRVVASAAVTEGQKLVVGAAGQVAPAGAAQDVRQVIGEALQAAGAGQACLIYIY